MSIPVVKFNVNDQPEFFREVRKKVNQYFKENNISKHANSGMVIKTVFMLSLYFMPLILMLTGVVSSLWPVMLMWVLMGFGMAGIGMSVMHDANHGSYSKNRHVNSVLGFMINPLSVNLDIGAIVPVKSFLAVFLVGRTLFFVEVFFILKSFFTSSFT